MSTLQIENYFEPELCTIYQFNTVGQAKKIYGLGEETLHPIKTEDWRLITKDIQIHFVEQKQRFYVFIQSENRELADYMVCIKVEQLIEEQRLILIAIYAQNYLIKHQLIELQNQQKAWYEGIRALTSSLELTELLSTIIEKTLMAMPGVDRGFFTLYDEKTKLLIPIASAGLKDSIFFFKTRIGEGIAGKTFEDGIARLYTNDEAYIAMENLTPENQHHLMVAVDNTGELNNQISMAAPVKIDDKNYGVLVVHQYTKTPAQNDLQLLQGFADQAAIAIRNAQQYTEIKQMNENLIKQQQIHELFTEMSLQNYGIQQIIRNAKELIDKEVIFLDMQHLKLYPFNERLQIYLRHSQNLEWAQETSIILKLDNEQFYVQPVYNDELLIGYFFVKSDYKMDSLDLIVLKQASVLITLKIVNSQSITEAMQIQRREFFNELITSTNTEEVYERISEFGMNRYKPCYVMLCKFIFKKQDQPFMAIRMQQFIERLEYDLNTNAFSFKSNDQLTIVLQNSQESSFEKIKQIICYWREKYEGDLRVSLGSEYNSLERLSNSHDEAKRTLRYLNMRSKTGVMRYIDLGISQLFVNQDGAVVDHFINHILSPLQTPKSKAIQLEDTLRLYIENNRSIAITAKQLHIHQNTLYHRLHKIEEILDVDLNDWNDYLELSLAVHLLYS